MAGVPRIMQAMVDNVLADIADGPKSIAETIVFGRPESQLAEPLTALQAAHPDVEIGCYPQYREGKYVVSVVIRGLDAEKVRAAVKDCHEI